MLWLVEENMSRGVLDDSARVMELRFCDRPETAMEVNSADVAFSFDVFAVAAPDLVNVLELVMLSRSSEARERGALVGAAMGDGAGVSTGSIIVSEEVSDYDSFPGGRRRGSEVSKMVCRRTSQLVVLLYEDVSSLSRHLSARSFQVEAQAWKPGYLKENQTKPYRTEGSCPDTFKRRPDKKVTYSSRFVLLCKGKVLQTPECGDDDVVKLWLLLMIKRKHAARGTKIIRKKARLEVSTVSKRR